MIGFLRHLPDRAETGDRSAAEGRTALAAALVEVARADGHYDQAERASIDRVLSRRFGLAPAEAAGLRAEGEAAQAGAVDLVRFTRAIKDAIPYDERPAVIEALWDIVYADGAREMHESALIRKLCRLLHIEDREAGLARQRVAARLGLE